MGDTIAMLCPHPLLALEYRYAHLRPLGCHTLRPTITYE